MTILNPLVEILKTIIVFFYDHVYPNYGVDIILLTIVVRIAMMPLTLTQVKSQDKIQRIQPQIIKIKQEYKNDREKINMETMKIYRENKINPLSGCLPLLLQLPILFALFMLLQSYPPIKEESFLWLSKLGQPDPYFILVIIFVITSFLTQQMMVTDPSQKAIKYIMPIAMGFIFYKFAAALFVYFNISNIWQLGERYIISRFFVSKESEETTYKKQKGKSKK
ncbi:MAG: membrane protein insertase YidC [Actinobacteria bacterium]|nr:membrane protein insertase YidC [Actinomycetota bacterium]